MGYNFNMQTHIEISVSIPERLLAELDITLYDPLLGKPAYGARSRLIATLLREYLTSNQDERALP